MKLRGYSIVPNDILETKIGIYTPEIVESILQGHPEVVDRWLQKLHEEYISNKKSCDFENDPVACFTLSVYEQFEKHFKSWEDGGLIAISLPRGRTVRVTKKPLISMVSGPYLVCNRCMTSFSNVEEYELHRRQEDASKPIIKAKTVDTVAPTPAR
ncbi:MAG: hypothetical protein MN733_41205 [Nitrososphaera sp.]|nr:hypothetical protein [Nitrososphaera sp.]